MYGASPPGSSALLAAFSPSNPWLIIDQPRVRLDKPRTNLLRATQTLKSSLYVYFCSPVFGRGDVRQKFRKRVMSVVSLLITLITQFISSVMALRGNNLLDALEALFLS